MEQLRFEMPVVAPPKTAEPNQVVLAPETIDAVIAQMARALLVVVRAAQEADYER